MHSTLAVVGVGSAAGLIAGIVGSPFAYAFWRARKTSMLSVRPFLGWSGTLTVSVVVAAAMMLVIAAAILPGSELRTFLGSTLVALVTAMGVWRGVIVLARVQESRHGFGEERVPTARSQETRSCRGSGVSLSVPRDGVRIAFRTGLAGHRNGVEVPNCRALLQDVLATDRSLPGAGR